MYGIWKKLLERWLSQLYKHRWGSEAKTCDISDDIIFVEPEGLVQALTEGALADPEVEEDVGPVGVMVREQGDDVQHRAALQRWVATRALEDLG